MSKRILAGFGIAATLALAACGGNEAEENMAANADMTTDDMTMDNMDMNLADMNDMNMTDEMPDNATDNTTGNEAADGNTAY